MFFELLTSYFGLLFKFKKFITMKTLFLTLIFVLFYCTITNAQLFTEQTDIEIPGILYGSIAWGDYNSDNFMDFMITGNEIINGTLYYFSALYVNENDNNFTEINDIFAEVDESSLEWGDYNNDNYLDILLSGFHLENSILDAYSEIYKNNTDKTFTWQEDINFIKAGVGDLQWGDYNNDANNDVLQCGLSNTGQIVSNIYSNNSYNSFSNIFAFHKGKYGSLEWGDYNNDGYLDFIITGWNSSALETKIFKNYGDSIFIEQTQFEFTDIQAGSVEWGDYNNDGFLDILLTGQYSGDRITKIFKNNGDEIFTELEEADLTGVSYGNATWGDFNNDGFYDILLVGSDFNGIKNAKIYKNEGNDIFIEQLNTSLTPIQGADCRNLRGLII